MTRTLWLAAMLAVAFLSLGLALTGYHAAALGLALGVVLHMAVDALSSSVGVRRRLSPAVPSYRQLRGWRALA